MQRKCSRRGMVLPLSLFAIMAVLGLVTVLGGLNQGVKTQIYRTNNHQLSFLIAYSAFSRVCAKVHSFSWPNRPFLKEPYAETKVSFQGGYYDLFVENTAGRERQADIYIRTNLAGISRLYFWRIKVNEDLLDVSNSIIVEMYATPDLEDFPTIGGPRPFAGKVDNLLAKRAANQKKSDQLAAEILRKNNLAGVLEKVGTRVPESFEKDWPVSPEEEMLSKRTPVTPADIEPPLPGEKPDGDGPDPSRSREPSGSSDSPNEPDPNPASAQDSMTGTNINTLAQQILSTSNELVTNTNLAWNEIDTSGGHADVPTAAGYFENASIAKEGTYDALDDLISQSKSGIAEAPSAAAREAMEEMVSQTVAAAISNIATSIAPGNLHFISAYAGHLAAQTTVEAVEQVIDDWTVSETITISDLKKMNSMISSVSGYKKSPEVAQKMADAVAGVQEMLDTIRTALAAAEARLAQLKALAAQAAQPVQPGQQTSPDQYPIQPVEDQGN